MKTRRLPRRVDLAALLDTLLICAVLTILIVRTELYLTNYPQLGVKSHRLRDRGSVLAMLRRGCRFSPS